MKMSRHLRGRAASLVATYAVEDEDPDEELEDEVLQVIEPGSEEEARGIRDAKLTTKAMYISVLVCAAIFSGIGILILEKKVTILLGSLISLAANIFYVYNLDHSIKSALNMPETMATHYMVKNVMLRYLVIIICGVGAVLIIKGNAAFGVLIELLTLKIAIYVTPLIKKRLDHLG